MSNTKKILIAIITATIGVCLVGLLSSKEEKDERTVSYSE